VIATVPMAITTLLTMMRAGDDGLDLGQGICRAPRVRLESAPGGTLGARLEGARAGAVGGTGTGSRRSSSRETGLDVVSMSPFVRAELRAGAAAAALDLGRHDHRGVDHRGRHDHRQLERDSSPG